MDRRNNRLLVTVGSICLFSVLAVGCRDLLVYENFNQIRQESSRQAEVERLIGKPTMTLGSEWMYEREELTVLVSFDESGTVARKQWIDHSTGMWEDSSERTTDAHSVQRTHINSSNR